MPGDCQAVRFRTFFPPLRSGHWFRRSADLLHQVLGMPNYLAYVEHIRTCHPDRPIPSERAFFEEFVKARYGDGPTRCC